MRERDLTSGFSLSSLRASCPENLSLLNMAPSLPYPNYTEFFGTNTAVLGEDAGANLIQQTGLIFRRHSAVGRLHSNKIGLHCQGVDFKTLETLYVCLCTMPAFLPTIMVSSNNSYTTCNIGDYL